MMIKTRLAPMGALVAGLGVAGCGDDATVVDEVLYRAVLSPMNDSGVSGTAELVEDLEDDVFTATVLANGVDADALHPQHVHADAECPTEAADANDDMVVDVVEGLPAYGAILIPLDGDLSEQAAGMPEGYPTAPDGAIAYEQTTVLSSMVSNLEAADPDSPLTGLEGPLALGTRTVVIHGVTETSSTTLPDTVQSIGDTPAYVTLPVACGTIEAVAAAD